MPCGLIWSLEGSSTRYEERMGEQRRTPGSEAALIASFLLLLGFPCAPMLAVMPCQGTWMLLCTWPHRRRTTCG